MRLLPIYIFITLLFSSCGHVENKSTKVIVTKDTIIKGIPKFADSNAVVLNFDTSTSNSWKYSNIRFQNVKPSTLSSAEIDELDRLTWELIKDGKLGSRSLAGYKRQYVSVLNDKGEKIVWINYFCWANDLKWKEQPFIVIDGGDCFFQLKINLKSKKCIDFWVNASA